MQAFSYLQRKVNDKDYITLGLIWVGLFVWGSLSNIFPYMPPMFGFLLASVVAVKGRDYVIFVFAYFLFYEADRGYFLFSTWLYYYIHTRYLIPLIASFMDCKKCLLVLSVGLGYLLYFGMLFLLGTLFLEQPQYYNLFPVFVYIAIESAIVMMVDDVQR